MSISSRITQIEQHLTDDYSVLEVAGADLTNVDKNILNLKPTWQERLLYFINNGTDVVWNNWEKVEGTGESLSLNNTEEAPMKIDLKGNTSQEGTPTPDAPQDIHVVSGDNTVKVENKNLTLKNVKGYLGNSSILVDNGSESFVFYATEGETYTFSSQTAMNRGQYAKVETLNVVNNTPITNKTSISVLPSYNSASFTCSFTGYCIVYVNSTKKDAIGETFQIEKGSSPTSYVAHTEASYHITLPEGMFLGWIPNTDYRDKIDKSTGKNLFDKDSISNGFLDESGIVGGDTSAYRTSDFIPILPNTAYYKTTTSSPRTKYYDKNKQPLNTTTYWDIPIGGNAGTFTTPSNAYYFRFSYPVTGVNANGIMINEGSTALPYEPYGKVWYLNKQIGKVVLNGSENWTKSSNTNVNRYYIPGIFINTILNVSTIDLISDYFTCITPIQSDAYNIGLAKLNNTSIMVNFSLSDTNFDTLQKFTTWLSTHNTIVYYVLATPTTTEITDSTLISQLDTIKRSYDEQTNITQVNNDLPFILDVTALKQLIQ